MMKASDSNFTTNSRMCIYSQRNLTKHVSRCVNYEFEDLICEIDDADLISPSFYRINQIKQIVRKCENKLNLTCYLKPNINRVHLKKNYDLFFALCQSPYDLLSLNAVDEWKKHCRISVCWIDEIWTAKLDIFKKYLPILSKFDYVILICSESFHSVQDVVNCHCSCLPAGVDANCHCFCLPAGVDAIRFSPYPNPPFRCIDVYNMGRKSYVTHQSLLKMAEQKKIFYIFDTISQMDTDVYKEHRSLVSNIAKRSRYFIANYGKINDINQTQGQAELGYRFFEGAASGTVMIGEAPDTDAFRKHFDWPDAVIHVPFDEPNISEFLADLDSQPERLENIRRNNVIQSLLRHDWVYRWKAVLEIVDLKPLPALIDRENKLQKLAGLIDNRKF